MTSNSISPIVTDENFRAAAARYLAREMVRSISRADKAAISRYGHFAAASQKPPFEVEKDFLRVVSALDNYRQTIEPLRPYRDQLDEFDNLFAATFHVLATREVNHE